MASIFKTQGFKYAKNLLFGVGASVVIIGAWGKLTHQPWANFALTLGLMTEAVIFAVSGIIPPESDYYWEKLYPGLNSPEGGIQGVVPQTVGGAKAASNSATAALDKMLEEAKIDQATINKLGNNLKALSDNVASMTNVANAQIATDLFAAQAKEATDSMNALSKNLDNLNKVYGNMLNAMRS
jgi:gliding motility-associated protein GldL